MFRRWRSKITCCGGKTSGIPPCISSRSMKPTGACAWATTIAASPDGSILWYWIGTHEACNKLLGQL